MTVDNATRPVVTILLPQLVPGVAVLLLNRTVHLLHGAGGDMVRRMYLQVICSLWLQEGTGVDLLLNPMVHLLHGGVMEMVCLTYLTGMILLPLRERVTTVSRLSWTVHLLPGEERPRSMQCASW